MAVEASPCLAEFLAALFASLRARSTVGMVAAAAGPSSPRAEIASTWVASCPGLAASQSIATASSAGRIRVRLEASSEKKRLSMSKLEASPERIIAFVAATNVGAADRASGPIRLRRMTATVRTSSLLLSNPLSKSGTTARVGCKRSAAKRSGCLSRYWLGGE